MRTLRPSPPRARHDRRAAPEIVSDEGERLVINVGCGPAGASHLPPHFAGWRQLRVDVDAEVEPDVIADLTDLSGIEEACADAVWASHCIEHLYIHEVPLALAQFRRLLKPDGFLCVLVPDLQTVAQYAAADRLHETLYQSPAGPVTPHDMLFGYGAAIAAGQTSMAHHCGFTPGMLQQAFREQAFGEVVLRRRVQSFELAAFARVGRSRDEAERNALMAALAL
jgi:SAM-dependent methyltransferase